MPRPTQAASRAIASRTSSTPSSTAKYARNSVSTTKYTWLSFLPKGLYEQFRRVANFYFLLIAGISLSPFSPVNPVTNVLPLVVVLAVSLAKEAVEDHKRSQKDAQMNARAVLALRGDGWQAITWAGITVGDILQVREGEYVPADLVLLSSDNPEAVAYVDSMNLDGETNLKLKQGLPETSHLNSPGELDRAWLEVECELPNSRLYSFTGNLLLNRRTLPLGPAQVVLRGCQVKNTASLRGLVLFTGHECKIMMGAHGPASKRSRLERRLDLLILAMFGLLGAMCLVDALGAALWTSQGMWYLQLGNMSERASLRLQFDPGNRFIIALLMLLTTLTLYSTLIPISLYVSMELIKYLQAKEFINKDMAMYHKATDCPAQARTSNLNEELGQVQYVFSDKTGTLTCNQMDFFKCSIAGMQYGHGVTEIQRTLACRAGLPAPVEPPEAADPGHQVPGFNFRDRRLMEGRWMDSESAGTVREFMKLLALCHTVIVEAGADPAALKYQAASPDEAALVTAAKRFGFMFKARSPGSVTISCPPSQGYSSGSLDETYQVLAVLEFSSARKRQSVVLRQPDGSVILYCKGADSVIVERLSEAGRGVWPATRAHLEEFGSHGLRTLCLAFRLVPEEEYRAFAGAWEGAMAAMQDRAACMDAVAETLEAGLTLLGATAIEDQLQQGVGTAIQALTAANIKVWVLTGDKMETAINIGFACSLLSSAQTQLVISSETPAVDAAASKGIMEVEHVTHAEAIRQLEEAQCRVASHTARSPPLALIVDGKALLTLLAQPWRQQLLRVAVGCAVVVCCRVSPQQKAEVVELVRHGVGGVTLAIGDGANDVPMIQAAHVGVGISGKEGMQAVMASDFALGQFRFLATLLLIHGQQSYRRISLVIGYFFYKNATFTLVQFWFNLYAGFSGQRFFDSWYQSFYNLIFTSIPVLVVGVLDQPVSQESMRMLPALYSYGRTGQGFCTRTLAAWLASALWQSAVCFWAPVFAHAHIPSTRSGRSFGLWAVGTLSYTMIVTMANVRLLMSLHFQTMWHYIAICGSILVYYAFIFVYCRIPMTAIGHISSTIYDVVYELAGEPSAWLSLVLGIVAGLMPDLAAQAAKRAFFPSDMQIVQEQESAVYLQAGHPEKLGRLNSVAAGERTKARFLRWGRGRPSRTAPVLAKDSSKQQLFVAVRKAEIEVSTSPGSGSAVPGPWAGMEARHGTAAAPIRGLLSHQPSTSSQPGSLMQTRSRAASLIAAVPGAEVPHASETCELSGDHLQGSPDQLSAGSSFKHTGYAFDHPGFESFFHEEAQRQVELARMGVLLPGRPTRSTVESLSPSRSVSDTMQRPPEPRITGLDAVARISAAEQGGYAGEERVALMSEHDEM